MSEFCFCLISLEIGFLQHEKRCSRAIVRFSVSSEFFTVYEIGAQWLSGRVLDSKPSASPSSLCGVLEQDTLILA